MGKLHCKKQVTPPWHFFPLIVRSQLHHSILALCHCMRVCWSQWKLTSHHRRRIRRGDSLLWYISCLKGLVHPYYKKKGINLLYHLMALISRWTLLIINNEWNCRRQVVCGANSIKNYKTFIWPDNTTTFLFSWYGKFVNKQLLLEKLKSKLSAWLGAIKGSN